MLKPNPVGWFEIPVTDMERAISFYENVLEAKIDLQPEEDGFTMAWFEMGEGFGAAGALVHGEGYVPSYDGSMVYFSTPDINKCVEKVEENGGKVIFPEKSIGEHGFIAWVEDSEGNRIAMHRPA